jgi:hypothetical protein
MPTISRKPGRTVAGLRLAGENGIARPTTGTPGDGEDDISRPIPLFGSGTIFKATLDPGCGTLGLRMFP